MAQNLKLEIFRITLKKKGGSDNDLKNFDEFFKLLDNDETEAYKVFIGKFKDFFNNEFKPNADKTKGISANKNNNFEPHPSRNFINGEVFGGNIGIDQIIFDQNNSVEEKGKVLSDQIASLPFFFKIWTPLDYTTGVFMVQSYSAYTVTDLLRQNLTKFFNEYGYSLLISIFIPETIKENYLKNSSVYKLSIIKDKLSKDKRKLINPLFAEFENLKVNITVSGFKEEVANFWKKLSKQEKGFIGSNLEDFDIEEENDYEIKAFYKDEEGHKANVGLKKNKPPQPTIFLPNSVKRGSTNHYDFKKLNKFTDTILVDIQKEINYINNN